MTIKITLRKANRQMYIAALADTGGNRVKAARQLGISRRTLQRNLPKMGLSMRLWRHKKPISVRPERLHKATPPNRGELTLREQNQKQIVDAIVAAGGSLSEAAYQIGIPREMVPFALQLWHGHKEGMAELCNITAAIRKLADAIQSRK